MTIVAAAIAHSRHLARSSARGSANAVAGGPGRVSRRTTAAPPLVGGGRSRACADRHRLGHIAHDVDPLQGRVRSPRRPPLGLLCVDPADPVGLPSRCGSRRTFGARSADATDRGGNGHCSLGVLARLARGHRIGPGVFRQSAGFVAQLRRYGVHPRATGAATRHHSRVPAQNHGMRTTFLPTSSLGRRGRPSTSTRPSRRWHGHTRRCAGIRCPLFRTTPPTRRRWTNSTSTTSCRREPLDSFCVKSRARSTADFRYSIRRRHSWPSNATTGKSPWQHDLGTGRAHPNRCGAARKLGQVSLHFGERTSFPEASPGEIVAATFDLHLSVVACAGHRLQDARGIRRHQRLQPVQPVRCPDCAGSSRPSAPSTLGYATRFPTIHSLAFDSKGGRLLTSRITVTYYSIAFASP